MAKAKAKKGPVKASVAWAIFDIRQNRPVSSILGPHLLVYLNESDAKAICDGARTSWTYPVEARQVVVFAYDDVAHMLVK